MSKIIEPFFVTRCWQVCIVLSTTMFTVVIPPSAQAELFRFNVTSEVYGQTKTIGFALSLPDGVPDIRGLIFTFPGICQDWREGLDDPQWDAAARAIGFGSLAIDSGALHSTENNGCLCGNPYTDEPRRLLEATLTAAADASGQPHLVNAPLALVGYSQGGLNDLIIGGHAPERVLSISSVRGVSPVFEVVEEMKQVPGILMAGSIDTVVTPRYIQRGYESYRSQGAQMAYALHWNQGHGDNLSRRGGGQSTEYTWFWLSEVIRERYPADASPSSIPGEILPLRDIEMQSGWLGETPSLSPTLSASAFPEIAPFAEYSGDPTLASWLPNAAVANVYRAFVGIDPTRPNPQAPDQFLGSPLEFTTPSLFYSVPHPEFFVGDSVTAIVDPHEFDDGKEVVAMEFYDGDRLISTDTEGPEWSVTFMPNWAGIHALVAIATDDQGNRASTFRVVVVQPVPEPSAWVLIMFVALSAGARFQRTT